MQFSAQLRKILEKKSIVTLDTCVGWGILIGNNQARMHPAAAYRWGINLLDYTLNRDRQVEESDTEIMGRSAVSGSTSDRLQATDYKRRKASDQYSRFLDNCPMPSLVPDQRMAAPRLYPAICIPC